jgi:hypothetical protein
VVAYSLIEPLYIGDLGLFRCVKQKEVSSTITGPFTININLQHTCFKCKGFVVCEVNLLRQDSLDGTIGLSTATFHYTCIAQRDGQRCPNTAASQPTNQPSQHPANKVHAESKLTRNSRVLYLLAFYSRYVNQLFACGSIKSTLSISSFKEVCSRIVCASSVFFWFDVTKCSHHSVVGCTWGGM